MIEDAAQPATDDDPQPLKAANQVLETYGLAVVIEKPGGAIEPGAPAMRWLYVANTHRGLAKLFEGSHWAPQPGTSAPWVQALRRVADAKPIKFHRFAGYPACATALPLDAVLAEPNDEAN